MEKKLHENITNITSMVPFGAEVLIFKDNIPISKGKMLMLDAKCNPTTKYQKDQEVVAVLSLTEGLIANLLPNEVVLSEGCVIYGRLGKGEQHDRIVSIDTNDRTSLRDLQITELLYNAIVVEEEALYCGQVPKSYSELPGYRKYWGQDLTEEQRTGILNSDGGCITLELELIRMGAFSKQHIRTLVREGFTIAGTYPIASTGEDDEAIAELRIGSGALAYLVDNDLNKLESREHYVVNVDSPHTRFNVNEEETFHRFFRFDDLDAAIENFLARARSDDPSDGIIDFVSAEELHNLTVGQPE